MQALSFSTILQHLKAGRADAPTRAARSGWNGKDLFIQLQRPDEHSKMTLPYLYIEYPDGRRCPWLASQTDLLTDDWMVIPVE